MKVKFANRIYEVLFTKKLAGLTMYAVEDEPNHIDWLINVEVVDAEKKELKKISQRMISAETKEAMYGKPTAWSDEDEKIRKEIIKFIKKRDRSGCDYDYDQWLDWLEKQGEHANFLSKIQVGDKVTRNEGGVLVNISQLNRVAKKRKKQGEQNLIMAKSPQLREQKPTKNIVEIWKDMRLEVYQQASGNRHESNYSDDTTKMFSLNDIDEIIEKMSEQNPTDEEMVEALRTEYEKGRADAIAEMQKEWSEEDETKLRQVEYACMKFYGGDCSHIDWLRKVTRTQNTWKPTEEQMEALQYVYRNCNPPLSDKLGWDSIKTLELMYQELKKL